MKDISPFAMALDYASDALKLLAASPLLILALSFVVGVNILLFMQSRKGKSARRKNED